jgi:hypothetical protein
MNRLACPCNFRVSGPGGVVSTGRMVNVLLRVDSQLEDMNVEAYLYELIPLSELEYLLLIKALTAYFLASSGFTHLIGYLRPRVFRSLPCVH